MKFCIAFLFVGSVAAFAPIPKNHVSSALGMATRAVSPKKTGLKIPTFPAGKKGTEKKSSSTVAVAKKGTKKDAPSTKKTLESKVKKDKPLASAKKGTKKDAPSTKTKLASKLKKDKPAAAAKKDKPLTSAKKGTKKVASAKKGTTKNAPSTKTNLASKVKKEKPAAGKFARKSPPKLKLPPGPFEKELGVQRPVGFLDPLNLLGDASQERFDELRYTEIKHGRICQLAFLGNIITRAGIHLPGTIDSAGTRFDSIPNGWAALSAMPPQGLFQMIFFVGILELFVMKDRGSGEFIGDFRNGVLDYGWDTFTDEQKYQKRGIELNNGRAAMLGILGLMVHEQLGTNLPIVGQM